MMGHGLKTNKAFGESITGVHENGCALSGSKCLKLLTHVIHSVVMAGRSTVSSNSALFSKCNTFFGNKSTLFRLISATQNTLKNVNTVFQY